MAYVSYSDKLEEKLSGMGVLRVKKDISVKNGIIEAGSYIDRIYVWRYNAKTKWCCLHLYGFRNNIDGNEAEFDAFKISDWFEPCPELTELRKAHKEAESKFEISFYSAAVLIALIAAIVAIVIPNLLIMFGVIGITIIIIVAMYFLSLPAKKEANRKIEEYLEMHGDKVSLDKE